MYLIIILKKLRLQRFLLWIDSSYVIKDRILSSYNIKGMETYNDKEKEDKTSIKVEKSAVSLKEIDDKLSSIDSIINDSYE